MTFSKQSGFEAVRGVVRHDELMSRHTSWQVGGPARYFFVPADLKDLSVFLQSLGADLPILWVGLGSNLLVRDGGFDGAVIVTHRGLSRIERDADAQVRVQAGVSCARLARFASRHGLAGAEFMAGIPGTVGGALAMNAGAFGAETWQWVRQVEMIDRNGRLESYPAQSFDVTYRDVALPVAHWFTGACFSLQHGDPQAGQDKIRSLLAQRGKTQPIRESSAGSVFRNPPGDHAARLIEAAGLKGKRHGGAAVSTQHANFIINDQHASARDIETLIDLVRDRVATHAGVTLEREVRFVGVHR